MLPPSGINNTSVTNISEPAQSDTTLANFKEKNIQTQMLSVPFTVLTFKYTTLCSLF